MGRRAGVNVRNLDSSDVTVGTAAKVGIRVGVRVEEADEAMLDRRGEERSPAATAAAIHTRDAAAEAADAPGEDGDGDADADGDAALTPDGDEDEGAIGGGGDSNAASNIPVALFEAADAVR